MQFKVYNNFFYSLQYETTQKKKKKKKKLKIEAAETFFPKMYE